MKKITSLLMSLILCLSIVPQAFGFVLPNGRQTVFAEDIGAQGCADLLYLGGLFNGVGTVNGYPDYALDKTVTRAEAITMVIRLMGQEEAAKTWDAVAPFDDMVEWAKPYINYGYYNGIVNGTGPNKFSPNDTVTAQQYATMLLRAIGYKDGERGFSYSTALNKLYEVGGSKENWTGRSTRFLRSDLILFSYNILNCRVATGDNSVCESIRKGYSVEYTKTDSDSLDFYWWENPLEFNQLREAGILAATNMVDFDTIEDVPVKNYILSRARIKNGHYDITRTSVKTINEDLDMLCSREANESSLIFIFGTDGNIDYVGFIPKELDILSKGYGRVLFLEVSNI